jgi:phenylacetate-CoA ligase
MNPYLLKRAILPAWQHLKRQNSLQLLPYLETTQWLPASELLDLQWARIGTLLKHAYEHVPYYQEIMRERRIDPNSIAQQRSLEPLPLLDRATISEQLDRLRGTNVSAERFVANGTGGSTGEPLRFFDDRQEAGWSDAAIWRSHRWFGVDVGDRCTYLWGSNFDLSRFQGFSGRLRSRLLNLQMLPAWELSEKTAPRFYEMLGDFRPRLLLGYAGALYEWARLLGTGREPIPGLSAVIASAETLDEEAREIIEGSFKVPVYNRYGGRDIHFVAQECREREGLHINCESVFVEMVRDGRPAAAGELGEIVVTRLDNFAMPFIRYRSGDLGIVAKGSCRCGRSLPLIEKIEGRLQDAIVTSDGRIISGLFFAHMMKDCPEVKAFQVHQLSIDQLLVMVVLKEQPFSSQPRIQRIIEQYMGRDMKVRFEVQDALALTPSGKRRITISHIKNHTYSAQPTAVSVS